MLLRYRWLEKRFLSKITVDGYLSEKGNEIVNIICYNIALNLIEILYRYSFC